MKILLTKNLANKKFPATTGKGPPWERRPNVELVLLFTSLFAATLARQSFFHALLFARLEVEGVTFHFLNNVLLLDLTFKPPQSVL